MLIMDANGTVFGHKRGWRDPEYPFPKNLQLNVESAHWHDTAWQEVFRGRLLNQNFIATTSNMMFTKQLHARLGGFRDYRYCHDWDFALRAAFDGDVGWCRQPLTLYRIHGSNTISEAKERIRAEVSRMFERFSDDVHGIEATPISRTGLAANRYLQAA
jgi:hypothetical protein